MPADVRGGQAGSVIPREEMTRVRPKSPRVTPRGARGATSSRCEHQRGHARTSSTRRNLTMGKTAYLPKREIEEAHDVAMRALSKAHGAFIQHEAEAAKLKEPAKDATLRNLTPSELFDRKMAAAHDAEVKISEAAGDREAIKKTLSGLARSLEMSHVMGAARFTEIVGKARRANTRTCCWRKGQRAKTNASALPYCVAKTTFARNSDDIRTTAKQEGVDKSAALATLFELTQHARRSKMGMSTMAAISTTQSELANSSGRARRTRRSSATNRERLDTIHELGRSLRRPEDTRREHVLQAQRTKSA